MTMTATNMNRAEVIKAIKTALQKRSGKTWSVTGGKGTAYGWLNIDAPPARRTFHHVATGRRDEWTGHEIYDEVEDSSKEYGHMSPADRKELAELLGKDSVHVQGVSIPAGSDYYQEYIDRANGIEPTVFGERYWD